MRPPGVVDQRYTSLYLFAACRPGTDETFALALPRADAGAIGVFLEHWRGTSRRRCTPSSSSIKRAGMTSGP